MIKWTVPDKPVLGAPPWRKRRPNRPRRPWLVSLVILTRLISPVTTVVFADQLAQLTPTARQAKLAVIARALGLDVPAPVMAGEGREPLRDSGAQVRTVLCVRSVSYSFGYLSPTGKKNVSNRTFVHLYIRIFAIFCARDSVLSVLGRKGCSPPHIPRFVPMVMMS